jgi:hypothetical protein
MTQEEAKKELRYIKDIEKDIRSVELEIERLMTLATKMTPSYEIVNSSGGHKDKIAEALIRIDEYKTRLTKLVKEDIEYKNRCLGKVRLVEPRSLGTVLFYYYFMNYTMEKTAEKIGKSYQWTYTMFQSALDEYAKISE